MIYVKTWFGGFRYPLFGVVVWLGYLALWSPGMDCQNDKFNRVIHTIRVVGGMLAAVIFSQ